MLVIRFQNEPASSHKYKSGGYSYPFDCILGGRCVCLCVVGIGGFY